MSHVISLWRDHAPRAISNSLVAVNRTSTRDAVGELRADDEWAVAYVY